MVTKMTKKIVVLLIALTFIVPLAFAANPPTPTLPHYYFGDVKIDSVVAQDGLTITAKISNVNHGQATTAQGKYDIKVTDALNGQTVEFFIGNTKATQTATFQEGGVPTRLDLTFPAISCTESWTYGEWSAWGTCTDSSQSRTRACTDSNNCGTTINRPALTETQTCTSGTGNPGGGGGGGGSRGITESSEVDTTHNTTPTETTSTATPLGENNNEVNTDGNGITGAATTFFTTTNIGIGVGVIAVLSVGAYLFLRRR